MFENEELSGELAIVAGLSELEARWSVPSGSSGSDMESSLLHFLPLIVSASSVSLIMFPLAKYC